EGRVDGCVDRLTSEGDGTDQLLGVRIEDPDLTGVANLSGVSADYINARRPVIHRNSIGPYPGGDARGHTRMRAHRGWRRRGHWRCRGRGWTRRGRHRYRRKRRPRPQEE